MLSSLQRRPVRLLVLFAGVAIALAFPGCSDPVAERSADRAARPSPQVEAPAPLLLAEHGRSGYEIVCAADASGAARAGAVELHELLRLVTGAEVPVRAVPTTGARQIVIGRNPLATAAGIDAAGLGKDAFLIQATAGRVFLLGSDAVAGDLLPMSPFIESLPAGSYFAVVEFARRYLGVEWYMPGPMGIDWRPLERLAIPADLRIASAPRFPRRLIEGAWMRPPRSGAPDAALSERGAWGRHLLLGNTSLVDFQHAYFMYLNANTAEYASPEAYGTTHPEFFAMVDGQRSTNPSHYRNQLCVSNPAVAATYAANIIAQGRKTGTRSFSLSQNDGAGHCQCPACTAWDGRDAATGEQVLADRNIRFANRVAEAVCAALPDARLGIYAYDDTLHPPISPVVPHPNLHISDVYNYLPDSWHSSAAERTRILTDLTAWRGLAKHVTITSYYDIYGNWSLPWDTSDVIGAVLRTIAPFPSSDGVVLDNCRDDEVAPGVDGARLWVAARMLWDPAQDPADLQARFYRGAFGEGPGRHIAAYFAAIDRSWRGVLQADPLRWGHERTAQQCTYPVRVYTPVRAECRALIDQAVAAAATLDERTRWRVDRVARGWRFTELTLDAAAAAQAARKGSSGADPMAAWQRAVDAGLARRAMVEDPANRYAISPGSIAVCTGQRPLGIVEAMPDGATLEIAVAAPADPAITLDGRLDEAVWQALPATRTFVDNQQGAPAPVATWVKAFRTADALVLGYRCAEPAMAALRTVDAPNRVYEGDVVEFYCSPTGVDQEYSQFLVNPNGVAKAYLMRGDKGEDLAWKPQWAWAATRDADGWSVEMRIPFADLGLDPAKLGETTPRVDFFRERSTGQAGLSAWIPTGGGFAQPAKFGRMRFPAGR